MGARIPGCVRIIKPTLRIPRVYAACLALLVLSQFATPVRACNVPVFRYALEHWPADPYEVIVFHRGLLSPEDQAAVDLLKQYEDDQASGANLLFHRVDLSQLHDQAMDSLFQD